MKEYIPTTAGVRDAYSAESTDGTYANQMFDLWLAKYKAKTIAKEQERILKELQELSSSLIEITDGKMNESTLIYRKAIHHMEIRIKGEQK